MTYANGYSRLSIIVHWLAALVVIILFTTHEGKPGSLPYSIHVGGGALIGWWLIWRVGYRLKNGTATKPSQHVLFNIASRLVIYGFLLAILIAVITGYLTPWLNGQPIDIFNIISIPSPLAPNFETHRLVRELHELSGQAIVPLLVLHVLGALKHHFFDKDDVMQRMFKPVNKGL